MDMKDRIAARVVALARQRGDLWNESLGQIRYKRLAALAGLTGPTIERMVGGQHAPTTTTVEAVAIALGVPPEALLLSAEQARLVADYDRLPAEGQQMLSDAAARLVRELVPERKFSLFRSFPPVAGSAAQMRLDMDKPPISRASVTTLKRVGIAEE